MNLDQMGGLRLRFGRVVWVGLSEGQIMAGV